MKKHITALALAGLGLGALNAQSDYTADLSISGSFDFETMYVFRAKQVHWQSLQPGVEFGYPILGGEAYAGVWSAQPVDNKGGVQWPNEVDFYGGYAFPVADMLTLDVGFTYYWYPDSAPGGGLARQWREIYIGATVDVILSPALYFFYDFDQQQTVLEGSIGYDFDLGDLIGANGLSLDLGAYYGWLAADRYFGVTGDKNGYMYGGATADLVYAFSENVGASVGVRWAANNDGSVMNQGGRQNNIWFGASVGFAY